MNKLLLKILHSRLVFRIFEAWHLRWCRKKYHFEFGHCADVDWFDTHAGPIGPSSGGSIAAQRAEWLRWERGLLAEKFDRETWREAQTEANRRRAGWRLMLDRERKTASAIERYARDSSILAQTGPTPGASSAYDALASSSAPPVPGDAAIDPILLAGRRRVNKQHPHRDFVR